MRFELTDEQCAIADSARAVCAQHESPGDRAPGAPDPFWTELAAHGFAGIAVPEQYGGQGLGLLECALVVEQLGRGLAPGTFFGNAAAAAVLTATGEEAQRERWLPLIASGSERAAFATLMGERAIAVDAEGAAALVAAGDGSVRLVDGMPALSVAGDALDRSRSFARADLSDAATLSGDAVAATDRVEVLLAAELVGVAQRAMELAVEHATQRQQFGRPIGAYQAVSHRCADMLVAIESARSAMLGAAWTADHEPERLAFAASVAKATAADAAWQVTTSALQVHGGMGFTWEHPIHRFVRRAAMSGRILGSADHHLERLAQLGGL